MSILTKSVQTRISWPEVIDAVVDMAAHGKPDDFTAYDLKQLEEAAGIIRDKLATRSIVRARPYIEAPAAAELDAVSGS